MKLCFVLCQVTRLITTGAFFEKKNGKKNQTEFKVIKYIFNRKATKIILRIRLIKNI